MRSMTGARPPRYRVHARLPVRLRALVTSEKQGWKRHAPVENMGLGGARMFVDETLAPGDAVTLAFTAPTLWDPLVLQAKVAWVGSGAPPYTAGVTFEHTSAEAALALYELISTMGYE
jgi:hypothetical protein